MKHILTNNPGDFAPRVANHIREVATDRSRRIRLGVPGGRGSVPVIQGLASCDQDLLDRVELYLVDERLTGPSNRDTLFDVGLRHLVEEGRFSERQLHIPQLGVPFFDFEGDLDLLYLGVGEDGHVASLFPGSYPDLDGRDVEDTAYVAQSPKPPMERLTVTYRGFHNHARKTPVFLMFFGEGKRQAYERLIAEQEIPTTLPCMYFPREWFLVTIVTDLQGVRS